MKSKKQQVPLISLRLKGFLLFALALFLALSLLSYSSHHSSHNWLGLVGHVFAWILFYIVGLSSFLVPFFIGWIGIRLLLNSPLPQMKRKIAYFLSALFSLSILLAMASHASSHFASHFQKWVHSDFYPKQEFYDPDKLRHYLGGVPLHHFYVDSVINLKYFLGKPGTFLVFFSLFLVSCVLLIQFPFSSFLRFFSFIAQKLKRKERPQLEPAVNTKKALKEEIEDVEVQLVREDPLKKITRVNLIEKKPEPKLFSQTKKTSHPRATFPDSYTLPPPSLLTEVKPHDPSSLKNELKKQAALLEETLLSFGIEAKVGDIHSGPTITSFEVHPAVGVKVQKIKTLENDIALNLQAKSIRIIAPIPGKAAVGIEIPNPKPCEVGFRDLLENYIASPKKADIPLLLGKKVNGEDVFADLTKMPHLIIAGATGSGKSVCINTLVMSIVMNAHPAAIKLLMVDPKKVELTAYTHLPHMLAPVITEAQSAKSALVWLVKEMERRYEIFRQLGIRHISGFNCRTKNKELEASLELNIPDQMPFIVVIIDELADLMMVSSSEIETPIARIAQMARATGIHMILATQRPSREVITGLIKANFPSRIAFKVSSRVNSQIVIDDNGAEMLLGNGDMLFLAPGTSSLIRSQGAFIRDDDINKVIHHICSQASANYIIPSFDDYRETLDQEMDQDMPKDSLYEEAKKLVLETGNASTTFLQRKLKVGYARAASLMDQLEANGIIGPSEGAKPRKIYYPTHDNE